VSNLLPPRGLLGDLDPCCPSGSAPDCGAAAGAGLSPPGAGRSTRRATCTGPSSTRCELPVLVAAAVIAGLRKKKKKKKSDRRCCTAGSTRRDGPYAPSGASPRSGGAAESCRAKPSRPTFNLRSDHDQTRGMFLFYAMLAERRSCFSGGGVGRNAVTRTGDPALVPRVDEKTSDGRKASKFESRPGNVPIPNPTVSKDRSSPEPARCGLGFFFPRPPRRELPDRPERSAGAESSLQPSLTSGNVYLLLFRAPRPTLTAFRPAKGFAVPPRWAAAVWNRLLPLPAEATSLEGRWRHRAVRSTDVNPRSPGADHREVRRRPVTWVTSPRPFRPRSEVVVPTRTSWLPRKPDALFYETLSTLSRPEKWRRSQPFVA